MPKEISHMLHAVRNVTPCNYCAIIDNYFWCSLHTSFAVPLKKSGNVKLNTPSENQRAVTVDISGMILEW